jgi:ABC-type multidrug transport system fused ATPase/permease subunit
MGSNYWIAWATEENHNVTKEKLIGIFILLSGGSSVFILGRAVFLATIAIETAQRLFLGMISSVFRASISFFDATPSSRILSRVSFLLLFQVRHSLLCLTSSHASEKKIFIFIFCACPGSHLQIKAQ